MEVFQALSPGLQKINLGNIGLWVLLCISAFFVGITRLPKQPDLQVMINGVAISDGQKITTETRELEFSILNSGTATAKKPELGFNYLAEGTNFMEEAERPWIPEIGTELFYYWRGKKITVDTRGWIISAPQIDPKIAFLVKPSIRLKTTARCPVGTTFTFAVYGEDQEVKQYKCDVQFDPKSVP